MNSSIRTQTFFLLGFLAISLSGFAQAPLPAPPQKVGVAGPNTVNTTVDSIEWVAIDSPLTANTNAGEGLRIYPEKQTPTDNTPRNTVNVRAKISSSSANVKVYFRSFDVDDPSANWNGDNPRVTQNIDRNNKWVDPTDTQDSQKGGDNLFKAGEIPQKGSFPTGGDQAEAFTDEYGYATIAFTVGAQPGNNYRVVASTSKAELSPLTDDNIPANNDSTLQNTPMAKVTSLLTVWRTIHIERDSMRAIQGNENSVVGNITALSVADNGSQDALIDVNLETDDQVKDKLGNPDNSSNLGSAGQTPQVLGNGRFSSGYITVGEGNSSRKTSNLLGNGVNFIRTVTNKKFDIPFSLSKVGNNTVVTGQIIGLGTVGLNSVFTVVPDGTPLTDSDYASEPNAPSTINVAGQNFSVSDNNGDQIVLTTNEAKLNFVLHDDDDDDILPYKPVITSLLGEKFAPAYITIAVDGGGNPNNDQMDLPFYRNLSSKYQSFSPEFNQSRAYASASYWRTTIVTSYQSLTKGNFSTAGRADNDSNEGILGAESALTEGVVVYLEEERDVGNAVRDGNHKFMGFAHESTTYAHEIGHIMGCPDRYTPGAPGAEPCRIKNDCGLMENNLDDSEVFISRDLGIIRSHRVP